MKKMIALAGMMVLAAGLHAQFEFQAYGEYAFAYHDDWETGLETTRGEAGFGLGGIGADFRWGKMGFSSVSSVRFNEPETGNAWSMDFDSRLGLKYDLIQDFLGMTIYGEAGFGAAGFVALDGSVHYSEEAEVLSGLNLSLFPYVGAGAFMRLDNMIVGGKIHTQPWSGRVPVSPIPAYTDLNPMQLSLYLGFTTGKIGFPGYNEENDSERCGF